MKLTGILFQQSLQGRVILKQHNNANKGKNLKRWNSVLIHKTLNPDWNQSDCKKLLNLHLVHGSKWKQISKEFVDKDDNYLKNQFFSMIRKALRRICKYLKISKSKFLI